MEIGIGIGIFGWAFLRISGIFSEERDLDWNLALDAVCVRRVIL